MRLGGPILESCNSPKEWIAQLKKHGYKAAYCPVKADAKDSVISEYVKAAADSDIVIAEVGIWNNPLHPDESVRKAAIEYGIGQLTLAEKVGAHCCVNIAGSRSTVFDGPHPENLTEETFEMTVKMVQTIIDAVKPDRTYFTLEPMPWIFPDSSESYLRLINAIDRKQFAAHLDLVNIINSPERYFNNTQFIKTCFEKLGPYIVSCHAKDIILRERLTVHLDEVICGRGLFDFSTFLTELNKLDPDIPLMLEHLERNEEYDEAAAYVRKIAGQIGVGL